jgi:hypothetical protein
MTEVLVALTEGLVSPVMVAWFGVLLGCARCLVWCPVGMYARWCNSLGVPWGDCYLVFTFAVGQLVLFLLASKEWL